MYSWTYKLRKTWLDKCLKSPVWEEPSRSDMINGAKHFSRRNNSAFPIFIGPCADNYCWKSLPEGYAKSYGFLLVHWLLIISILFLTEAIYSKIFRNNYLRNEKYFLNFLLTLINLDLVLNIFKKKTLTADVFFNLQTRKTWSDKCLKSPVSEDPSTSTMVNGPKHCSKFDDSNLTILIDPCEGNSGLKILSKRYSQS